MSKTITTTYFIDGIKHQNGQIIEEIYQKFRPPIIAFIRKSGGSREDAYEVFQEALIIIFQKIKKEPDFQLRGLFYNYLYKICWHLWTREAVKKYRKEVTIPEDDRLYYEMTIEEDLIAHQKYRLYRSKFETLSSRCQQLLQLFLEKVKLKDIARQMNYASENVAKKQKHNCQKKLISLIKNSALYQELTNNE